MEVDSIREPPAFSNSGESMLTQSALDDAGTQRARPAPRIRPPASVVTQFGMPSEGNPPANLPEPRFVRAGCRTEAPVRKVGVHVCIVGTVEQVEELEAYLEDDAFRDVSVFVDIDVCLKEVWTAELLWLLVASAAKSWNCEVALGDGPDEPCAVVTRLPVACSVRIVEVISVRVVVAAA